MFWIGVFFVTQDNSIFKCRQTVASEHLFRDADEHWACESEQLCWLYHVKDGPEMESGLKILRN